MKHLMTSMLLFMIVQDSLSQSTIPAVEFQSLKGVPINMDNYRGKKLIVYTVANAGDFAAIKKLKKLVEGSDSLVAIVIPVDDFKNSNIEASVKEFLKDSLPQNFIVSGIVSAKSRAISNGHPLLKWLSNKNENTHFDFDFKESGQALFINPKGELYGNILRCDFSDISVKKILNQQ